MWIANAEVSLPITFYIVQPLHGLIMPVSQENLSPGNCVAATVMSLTINVATVYPRKISGNTVARMLAIVIDN